MTTLTLNLALALLALSQAALPADPPTTTPARAIAKGSVSGFATAALWGTWEEQLAPAYTRLAALRHQAALELTAGRIPVDRAQSVQSLANRARRALDASRRGDALDPTHDQRQQLDAAKALIAQGYALLEGRQP